MPPEEIYRRLILIRECEERIRREYPSDELKTPTHLGIGSEAIAVGVVSQLPPGTKCFGTYRNHSLYLALNGNLDSFFGELYGKVSGCGKGKAGSMHLSNPDKGLVLTSAVVGTTIPVAVGAALAEKYQETGKFVVSFFGDGATEEGVFHESLNFAALHKLKILFVCEDNGLAIHTDKSQRQTYNLEYLVTSYGIGYGYANGLYLSDVVQTTARLIESSFRGPVFLHVEYHRFLEHVGPNKDYDVGYRVKPSLQKDWDPLEYLDIPLLNSLSTQDKRSIKEKLLAEIEGAVERAKSAPFPKPNELYGDVYED